MNLFENLAQSGPMLRGAVSRGHLRVLRSMLGPAYRGLIQQRGKHQERTEMALGYAALFDWRYQRGEPQLARLYEAAKSSQWNASTDLDWSTSVDPDDPEAIATGVRDALTRSEELRARGLEHARRFTWLATGRAHLQGYADAL